MKLAGRLAVAGLVAAVTSAGLAACYEHVGMRVTLGEFGNHVRPEMMARIRAQVIDDGIHDAIQFGRVLVPLTVTVAWWRERRRGRRSAT